MGHPGITRMKSHMRSYIYWAGIDKEIKDIVKHCRCCAMAAKALSVKINPWPKMVKVTYVRPMNGIYYLTVVDSFTKWQNVGYLHIKVQ